MTRLLLPMLAAGLLTSCSSSCDELAGLQAEREERRASQQALLGTADDEEIGAADTTAGDRPGGPRRPRRKGHLGRPPRPRRPPARAVPLDDFVREQVRLAYEAAEQR